MDGQSKSKRVVFVHDASGEVRFKAVKWVLNGFLLKDGDIVILLSVLHQIPHPMGYKIPVDSSMFGGANQRAIDDEVARKKKEYDDNAQLLEISKLYQNRKVDFKIELVAGPIPKNVAVDASKKFKATWVILDRKMKRDKKYFLEKLSCGISTMKMNDKIIDIRGPKAKHQTLVSYDEMLPFDNKISNKEPQNNDQDLFSIEFDTSCTSSTSTRTSFSESMLPVGNNQDDKINESSTLLEVYAEEHEKSPGDEVPMSEKLVLDYEKCIACNATEEVNEDVETISQSQRDEEVNDQYAGMSPVPKQAKHFYQGGHI